MRNVRRQRDDRGQALVEFVLIANILLIYTIYQFGIAFANYIEITDAARAAARKAATYGADTVEDPVNRSTAITQAIASAQGAADVPGMQVTLVTTPPAGGFAAGNQVKATVTAPYSIKIVGITVSSGLLSSSTTMRIEKRRPAS
jgi:Flp pilus assembly protein TadG